MSTVALEDLASACRAHAVALESARRAGDDRAIAVYRARHAGLSLSDVAQVLGCARAAVPALARRGEALAGEGVLSGSSALLPDPEGEGKEVMTNSTESTQRQWAALSEGVDATAGPAVLEVGGGQVITDSTESTHPPVRVDPRPLRCLRDGCETPVDVGFDLCPEHLWA